MNNGWITLHRRIKDHWLWKSKPFSRGQAWIDILLECNHSERKTLFEGRLVITERGQSSNAKKTWANRWGWSISATRHFLNILEKDEMISTHNARVTTVLTVLNYDSYQLKQTSEESQKDLTEISEESHKDTNKKVKKVKKVNNDNIHIDIQGLILTKDEYAKLCDKYSVLEVADIISSMENYKGLSKKYVSAYKTALNWLKRGSETSNQDFDWSKLT